VKDLGVLLDPRLKNAFHISSMVNKDGGALGLIKRCLKELDDPYITKAYLFLLSARYLSIDLPSGVPNTEFMLIVQKNFLLFALRRLNWDANRILPSYSSRLLLINLPSLANRRMMLRTVFIYNHIRGEIDSPDLVSQINFSVPCRLTRYYIPLFLNYFRSNYDF